MTTLYFLDAAEFTGVSAVAAAQPGARVERLPGYVTVTSDGPVVVDRRATGVRPGVEDSCDPNRDCRAPDFTDKQRERQPSFSTEPNMHRRLDAYRERRNHNEGNGHLGGHIASRGRIAAPLHICMTPIREGRYQIATP